MAHDGCFVWDKVLARNWGGQDGLLGRLRSCDLTNDYAIRFTNGGLVSVTITGGTAIFDGENILNGCNPGSGSGVQNFDGSGTNLLSFRGGVCNGRLKIIVTWNSSGTRSFDARVTQNQGGQTVSQIFQFFGRQVKVTEPNYGILCLPDGNNHSINVGSIGPTGATSKTWSYTVSDGSTANFSSPSSQYTTFNGLHSKAFWSINSTWTCPGESPSVGGVSFYAGDPTDQECSYYRTSIKEDKEEASLDLFTDEGTDELDPGGHLVQTRKNLNVSINTDDRTSLFPNPVSLGQPITLKVNKNLLKKQGYTPIIISDINGRIVFNSRVENVVTTLNLDNGIDKGYYIIQVVGDSEVKKIPFIIR
jgi:hypothetical protein